MTNLDALLPMKKAWGFSLADKETGTFSGGKPYLDNTGMPMNENGIPYAFLFQVDLSKVETSKLDLHLPSQGYLQFFHSGDESNYVYGSVFDNNSISEKDTLVKLLLAPTDTVQDSSFVSDVFGDHYPSPLDSFHSRTYYEGRLIDSYPSFFGKEIDDVVDDSNKDQIFNEYPEWRDSKPFYDFALGGYQEFTQSDLRYSWGEEAKSLTLLLSSSSSNDLMWGDYGSAGFWIQEKDLNAGNYEKSVLYYDCY